MRARSASSFACINACPNGRAIWRCKDTCLPPRPGGRAIALPPEGLLIRKKRPRASLTDHVRFPELAQARLMWSASGCGVSDRIEELEFFLRQSECTRCHIVNEVIWFARPGDGQHMGTLLQDPGQADLRG